MSNQAETKTPRRDSAVASISSPAETAKIARQFTTALKQLGSGDGYRNFVELIDRIPHLEAEVQEKEKELKKASDTAAEQRTAHKTALEDQRDLLEDKILRFQGERVGFQQKSTELQAALDQRDCTITALKEQELKLKTVGKELQDVYKALKATVKERESEIAQLKVQCADAQAKNGELNTTLKALRIKTSTLDKEYIKTKQLSEKLTNALNTADAQIEEMEGYSVPLENVDPQTLANEFSKIWLSLTLHVKRFVHEDLPASMIQPFWEKLNDALKFAMDKPLPQSNSPVAKQLRTAGVLLILAEAVNAYLFRPIHQSPIEHETINDVLSELAAKQPQRETLLRSLLLAALDPHRLEMEAALRAQVIEDVTKRSGAENVVRPELMGEFKSSLDEILHDAQHIWRKVQCSTRVFETQFEFTQAVAFDWNTLDPQPNDRSRVLKEKGNVQSNDPEDDVVLFPQLVLVGNSDNPLVPAKVMKKGFINGLIEEARRQSPKLEHSGSQPRRRSARAPSFSASRNGQTKPPFLSQAVVSNGSSHA